MLGRVAWSPENSERANHAVVMVRVTTIANLGTEGTPVPPSGPD